MNNIDNFLLGLASGLSGALLIYLFRHLFAQVLSFTTGIFTPKLRGAWQTKFWKDNSEFRENVKLNQLFHLVWGTIYYCDKDRKYNFKGTVRLNILVATYEYAGPNRGSTFDRGSFTLLISTAGDVKKMTGYYSWTDDDSEKPNGDKYEWIKTN